MADKVSVAKPEDFQLTAVVAAFTPSQQQADFFEWIVNGIGSCILEAVAGAGKTTTLIEALKLMTGTIFFGAYNKKIAVEIEARSPKKAGLDISTMHSAGFRIWRKVAPRVQVDKKGVKCRDIFRTMIAENVAERDFFAQLEGIVLKLVSYAKQAGLGAIVSGKDDNNWRNLIEHFDIDTLDCESTVITLAKHTLGRSIKADYELIDFDDMIYAPLVHKARAYEYDWVLIDEAQDTNATRRALALLMLKRGGRLVAVGDRHQAIYGFTGADHDALDLIGTAVNAVKMPLTVTYRCPKAVVQHAHQYVSHIEAHPTAPEGAVTKLVGPISKAAVPGDAILCRFNAPILELVYGFIADGVAAKVEGRDIGTGLKALARRWKVTTFAALNDRLDAYLDRETAKYRAKEQEAKAAGVEDKVNCVKVIATRVQNINPNCRDAVEAICAEIDTIFDDTAMKDGKNFVLLSTIHKSKGREWNKVFWLQTGPSKWARMAWEQQQEVNLCYVATTRAKQELVLA